MGARHPNINNARDLELLRSHWSISQPAQSFLSYVLKHRHEVQGLLYSAKRTDDSIARGRIDARSTLLARRIAGNPSLVVYDEPVRSFNTGPNQVVAWILKTLDAYSTRFHSTQTEHSSYSEISALIVKNVAEIKRVETFREILKSTKTHRRPSPNSLLTAARSKRNIYHLAIAAYETLRKLEAGDEQAILTVLQSTLIAPLEQWRRFELAVALGIGEALSSELSVPMQISLIGKSAGLPIISCGKYELFWQSGGELYIPPPLEPSEIRLQSILNAYNMKLTTDRPDLVIVDRGAKRVSSIVEVKYLTGDSTAARFREAATQVVRYARGYSPENKMEKLLRSSLIALSRSAPDLQDHAAPAPYAIDFKSIHSGALRIWVRERLISSGN